MVRRASRSATDEVDGDGYDDSYENDDDADGSAVAERLHTTNQSVDGSETCSGAGTTRSHVGFNNGDNDNDHDHDHDADDGTKPQQARIVTLEEQREEILKTITHGTPIPLAQHVTKEEEEDPVQQQHDDNNSNIVSCLTCRHYIVIGIGIAMVTILVIAIVASVLASQYHRNNVGGNEIVTVEYDDMVLEA